MARAPDVPTAQAIAAAAAVFFDLLVLGALVVVLVPAWRLPAYALLFVSSSLVLAADEVMLARLDESALGPSMLLWTAGFGLTGAAALHPSMRELSVGDGGFDRRLTMGRLLLLAVPLALLPLFGARELHRLGLDPDRVDSRLRRPRHGARARQDGEHGARARPHAPAAGASA